MRPSEACRHLGLSRKEGIRLQTACGETLRWYGDASLPKVDMDKRLLKSSKRAKPVPAGSMSACLGGIVHAGPASIGQRVVLFFVGRPADSMEVYDSDVQVTAWSLPARLADEAQAAGDQALADKLVTAVFARSLEWKRNDVHPEHVFHGGKSLTAFGRDVKRVLTASKTSRK